MRIIFVTCTYALRGFVAVDGGIGSGLGNGSSGDASQGDENEELVHFEWEVVVDLITRRIAGEN